MRKLCKRTGVILAACLISFNTIGTDMAKAQTVYAAGTGNGEPQIQSLTPLKDIYKDKFLIGNIYNSFNLSGPDREMLLWHFNAVTPENMMKPDAMQMVEGNFTFDEADAMISFAQENGIAAVGHTLAWHSQTPDWMTMECTRDEAIQKLKSHIDGVAGHYAGKLLCWDVVNEAIEDGAKLPADGNWKSCLRNTPWLKNIGDDYIELAFRFAREADPGAKLYYNDYNLNDKNKAEIAAAMFADFKKRGVPIDGIGMQSHYSTELSLGSVEQSIKRFRDVGAKISVTELDVVINNPSGPGLPKENEIAQAQVYAGLFRLYNQYADSIERVTFWGYDDGHSWRGSSHPCLFNSRDYSPKEAYFAVADPEGDLQNHPMKAAPEPKRAEAVRGTPVIDGAEDEIWAAAKEVRINTMTMAWQGATGTAKMLWDENNLYVLVKVKDGVINADSVNAHEQDSVEIFVDENNGKTGYYEEDDGQFRVSCKNELTFGSNGSREGIQSAVAMTGDGYLVEIRIPTTTTLTGNMSLGFDLQINDSNERGERISVAKFNDETDNSWQSAERWGVLDLR